MTVNAKARALREKLAKGEFILAPGIYDGISARVADRMGFPALYMTGYGATASMLGLPDAGLATYSDMVGRAEMICSVIDTPLIADADTGYGGLLNVQRTVRGYEAAGVAAIQIEDQEMPKKCGHTPGRRVVPAEDMVMKLKVACEARRDEATLIVARTDARDQRCIHRSQSQHPVVPEPVRCGNDRLAYARRQPIFSHSTMQLSAGRAHRLDE